MILATVATRPALAEANADRQQEINMALDHYAEAKTEDQRAAVLDYLKHLDHKLVAGAVIEHIIGSRNGMEATTFNALIVALNPDGCAVVLDRLEKTMEPTAKGKLIVALRHCQEVETVKVLAGCLEDKRPVPFEARGKSPRRVCDLAYDELYLKLRSDARYGLDASPKMNGVISEKTPVKSRDALIAKLKAKLSEKAPFPAPSMTPQPPKPTTAAITLL